jgi:hypothetical protein
VQLSSASREMSVRNTLLMGQPLDKESAVLYGRFVACAYQMFESANGNLTPPPGELPVGWNMVAWIQMADFAFGDAQPKLYGLIAQNANNLDAFVLAIRGTESAIEWWDNAHVASKPFDQVPNAGRVAQGFDKIYSTLKVVPRPIGESALAPGTDGAKPLAGSFAEQVAQSIRSNVPHRKAGLEAMDVTMPFLIVTGHSLGAALCTLYVVENAVKKIINNPTVCTFASPRVGNAAFCAAYDALGLTSWRIVNAPDVVPNLPPDIFGFEHVAALSLFDSTGKVKATIACAHALDTYMSLLDPTHKPGVACIAEEHDRAMVATARPAFLSAAMAPAAPIPTHVTQGPVVISTPAGTVTINISVCLENSAT